MWVAAALVLGVGAYFLFVNGASSPQASYITHAVARGDLTVLVTATGSVQPTNKVDVSPARRAAHLNPIEALRHE
jgi:HlyD family secretion protein